MTPARTAGGENLLEFQTAAEGFTTGPDGQPIQHQLKITVTGIRPTDENT